MTDKKTLTIMTALLVLSSCAHEETKAPAEKKYSQSTQKEFEQIEKSDVHLNQKANIPPAHDIQNTQKTVKKTVHVQPAEPPKQESVELSTASPISAKSQERLQEINQNLAFYCMKHRNDGLFTSEQHCQRFTKKVLNYCEKKHKLINTVMVNCIKDQLKKAKR